MEDKDQKIEEQGRKINALTKQIETLTSQVDGLLRSFTNHKHEGPQADGSLLLQRAIDLRAGESLGAGGVSAFTGLSQTIKNGSVVVSDRTLATFGTGRDATAADGLNNSQIFLEHQYNTDSTTKQTFMYGIRAPIYIAATGAQITTGGTVLEQNQFKFTTNELAGAYIVVNTSDNSTFASFQIASNTATSITITGGTWTFTGTNLGFTIFMPIYNGSATYPWRRLYTGNGSGGGIRFGYGATAGGQNGLLYNDGDTLYWRNTLGTLKQIAFV